MDLKGQRIRQFLSEVPVYVLPWAQSDLKMHQHPFVELVLVHQGTALHIHENTPYPIHSGDAFIIAPGESHAYTKCQNLKIWNVLFDARVFGSTLTQFDQIPGFRRFFTIEPLFRADTDFKHKLHLSSAKLSQALSICQSIRKEIKLKQAGYVIAVQNYFISLALHLSRSFDLMALPLQIKEFNAKENVVQEAINLLESRFKEELSIDKIAFEVCLSPSRLAHVFKKGTGTTLVEFLNRTRIDKAIEFLETSTLAVSEVGFKVGFHDSGYFARIFKKQTGFSPLEYRKSRSK